MVNRLLGNGESSCLKRMKHRDCKQQVALAMTKCIMVRQHGTMVLQEVHVVPSYIPNHAVQQTEHGRTVFDVA